MTKNAFGGRPAPENNELPVLVQDPEWLIHILAQPESAEQSFFGDYRG